MTKRNKTDKKTPQAHVDDEAVKRDPVEGPENGDDTATLAREAEEDDGFYEADLEAAVRHADEIIAKRKNTPPNSPFEPGGDRDPVYSDKDAPVQPEDAPGPGPVPAPKPLAADVREMHNGNLGDAPESEPDPAPKRKPKADKEDDLRGIDLARLFDTSILEAYDKSGNEGDESDDRVSIEAVRAVLKERRG